MARRGRILAVALLLVASPVLAGCLSGDDDGGEPVTNESANGNETNPDELPQGREGNFAAFEETNRTEEGTGGMAHDHDYWQGKGRVRLFEDTAVMEPLASYNAGDGSFAIFRPPIGSLVYEGTARVEITITNPQAHACEGEVSFGGRFICHDNLDYHAGGPALPAPPHPTPPPIDLAFLHGASDPGSWESAGTLTWDEPFAIDVSDPKWTDMPHSTASLWAFRFESSDPNAHFLKFDVAVDLVRADGEEIPEWPGHPDFYADTCCRKILSASGEYGEGAAYAAAPEYTIDKLISYGTRTLYVWANVTSLEGPIPPTHVFLNFHNASAQTWNITNPFDENHTADVTEHHWVLHVDDNAMDTPYATQSRWEFIVQGAHTTPAISCYSGCFEYKIGYSLDIIATNEVLDGELYDRPRESVPVQ